MLSLMAVMALSNISIWFLMHAMFLISVMFLMTLMSVINCDAGDNYDVLAESEVQDSL